MIHGPMLGSGSLPAPRRCIWVPCHCSSCALRKAFARAVAASRAGSGSAASGTVSRSRRVLSSSMAASGLTVVGRPKPITSQAPLSMASFMAAVVRKPPVTASGTSPATARAVVAYSRK